LRRSAFAGENPVSEANMANELILIIEDNEKNRKLCRDVLQVKGYRTIESETAEEGLKLVEEKVPSLILMDIQLPGMDGITAMKQLKAAANTRTIPIIAITASAMTHNREAMLAEGFDGYQTKPFNLKEFLADVDRLIGKHPG
jgi:CheY-like chemotaxis protein